MNPNPESWIDISRPNTAQSRNWLILTVATAVFFAVLDVSAYQGFLSSRWADQTLGVVLTLASFNIALAVIYGRSWATSTVRSPAMAMAVDSEGARIRLRRGEILRFGFRELVVESTGEAKDLLLRQGDAFAGRSTQFRRVLRASPMCWITREAFKALETAALGTGLQEQVTPMVELRIERGQRIRFV